MYRIWYWAMIDREDDGRFVAIIPDLEDVAASGQTERDAVSHVADLAAEQKRIEGQGVKFIRSAGREEWGGVISTFADPDENYLQLIEFQP